MASLLFLGLISRQFNLPQVGRISFCYLLHLARWDYSIYLIVAVTYVIRKQYCLTVQRSNIRSLEASLSLHQWHLLLLRTRLVEDSRLYAAKWMLPSTTEVHAVEDYHQGVGDWLWNYLKKSIESKVDVIISNNMYLGVALLQVA